MSKEYKLGHSRLNVGTFCLQKKKLSIGLNLHWVLNLLSRKNIDDEVIKYDTVFF